MKKLARPTSNKKHRVTPATAPPADDLTPAATSSIVGSTIIHIAPTNAAASTKEANTGRHSLTDKLAEQLFGDDRHSSPKPDSAASPHARGILLLPTDAPIAPVAAANTPAPRQQNEEHHRVSHMQVPQVAVPRHEGYYAPHHPAPFSDYSGYYGPSEHPPPSWNVGPGLGWYPPGPGGAVHPSASGAPMGGPGHYWPRGPPFPNPYGHYLQPGAPPSHRHQDNATREHGDTM